MSDEDNESLWSESDSQDSNVSSEPDEATKGDDVFEKEAQKNENQVSEFFASVLGPDWPFRIDHSNWSNKHMESV